MVMDGDILDMMDAFYDDLETHIDKEQYEVVCVGFDPYNSKEFISRWCIENGEHGVEKVYSGSKN